MGVGKFQDAPHIPGLEIRYKDGGTGTTTFWGNRWGQVFIWGHNTNGGSKELMVLDYAKLQVNSNIISKGSINSEGNIIARSNLGVGKFRDAPHIAGIEIRYKDGGTGTTTFWGNRWGQVFTWGHNIRGGTRELMVLDRTKLYVNGKIGIGTANPDSRLTVAGNIHAREVKVTVRAGADFVFDESYQLRSLEETEKFIFENNHLPEISSASEMQKNGLLLAEMNIKLLQKIEELTLYLIEQNKQLKSQNEQNKAQQTKIELLEKKMSELENK